MSTQARGIEAVFPRDEFERRQRAAKAELARRKLDAAILTGPENIFYLTGQQTPGYYTFQCLVLPVEGEPKFLLRQLELTNFLRNTFIADHEVYQDNAQPADTVIDALGRMKLQGKRIAIEKRGWFLPIAFYEQLVEKMGKVEDASGVVEAMRRVKSPLEIKALEASARQAEAGIRAGMAAIKPGRTENDLVAAMMQAAIAGGAEYMGMEPLVSSGPRSGVPHATWRRRKLEHGDPIFLEMSGCQDRYHSGLMRTAWIGKPPALARELEKVVLEGLQAAIDAARPGVACEEVHMACQRVIDRAGMTDRYKKRTGYSLGVSFAPDWGEWQVLSLFTGIKEPLQPGMCFHVPTALREYGVFTVGISESILITEKGARQLGTLARPIHVIE
ncbi:MAG: aminopeptidase P family protein [Alphaproteobacteria bacterium]|nr:aminopeptidase P family protein [Alphaproteobacteria bacterium]